MGNFRLSGDEIAGLQAFLLSQRAQAPLDSSGVDWKKADTANGRALFGELRCVSCHAVNGRGGTMGPELTRIGDKVRRDWLFSYLKDPHRVQPDTPMLQYRLTDDQVRDLTAFLLEEYRSPDAGAEPRAGRVSGRAGGGGGPRRVRAARLLRAATSSAGDRETPAGSGRAWRASPIAIPTSCPTAATSCGTRPTTTSS